MRDPNARIDTDGLRSKAHDRLSPHEKITAALFAADGERVQLTPREAETMRMYEAVFTHWLENPHITDAGMARYIQERHGRSLRSAYRDMGRIKSLLGNVRNAGREFQRYRVIEMLLKAYAMAKEQEDPQAMTRAAAAIGKYTGLDKADPEGVDWNTIIPPVFEPTADVTVLGIETIPNIEEVRKELEMKYLGPAQEGKEE